MPTNPIPIEPEAKPLKVPGARRRANDALEALANALEAEIVAATQALAKKHPGREAVACCAMGMISFSVRQKPKLRNGWNDKEVHPRAEELVNEAAHDYGWGWMPIVKVVCLDGATEIKHEW